MPGTMPRRGLAEAALLPASHPVGPARGPARARTSVNIGRTRGGGVLSAVLAALLAIPAPGVAQSPQGGDAATAGLASDTAGPTSAAPAPARDPARPLALPGCPEADLATALAAGSAGAVLRAAERARIALGLCRDRARLMAEIAEDHARVRAALAPPAAPGAPADTADAKLAAARTGRLEADLAIARARIARLLAIAEMRVVAMWCAPSGACRALLQGSEGPREVAVGDDLVRLDETVVEIDEAGVRVRARGGDGDGRLLDPLPGAPDNFDGPTE